MRCCPVIQIWQPSSEWSYPTLFVFSNYWCRVQSHFPHFFPFCVPFSTRYSTPRVTPFRFICIQRLSQSVRNILSYLTIRRRTWSWVSLRAFFVFAGKGSADWVVSPIPIKRQMPRLQWLCRSFDGHTGQVFWSAWHSIQEKHSIDFLNSHYVTTEMDRPATPTPPSLCQQCHHQKCTDSTVPWSKMPSSEVKCWEYLACLCKLTRQTALEEARIHETRFCRG